MSGERMVSVSAELLRDALDLFDQHYSGHWALAPGADVGDMARALQAALASPPTGPGLRELAEGLRDELWVDACDREAHHVARSTFALCHARLSALLSVTAAQEGAAEADTWEAVHAVSREANHLPSGTGGVKNLPEGEADARYALIDSARAYRDVLKVATDLPELRERYHRDLAEFRKFRPAPDATPRPDDLSPPAVPGEHPGGDS